MSVHKIPRCLALRKVSGWSCLYVRNLDDRAVRKVSRLSCLCIRYLYNGYRVFPGGKQRPGRDADPSPPSSAVVMTTLWAVRPVQSLSACTRVLFTFTFYIAYGLRLWSYFQSYRSVTVLKSAYLSKICRLV